MNQSGAIKRNVVWWMRNNVSRNSCRVEIGYLSLA